MQAFQFLMSTIIGALSVIFILRVWFQYCQVDFYSPISQSLAKFTNPVLNPLSKIIPTFKRINFAALFIVFLLGFVKAFFINFYIQNVIGYTLGVIDYALIGILQIFSISGQTLLYLLFFSAIMSWFQREPNPIQYILYQLTEPLLKPIRRILPQAGMLDFSPMVLAFILIFINKLFSQYIPYWNFV